MIDSVGARSPLWLKINRFLLSFRFLSLFSSFVDEALLANGGNHLFFLWFLDLVYGGRRTGSFVRGRREAEECCGWARWGEFGTFVIGFGLDRGVWWLMSRWSLQLAVPKDISFCLIFCSGRCYQGNYTCAERNPLAVSWVDLYWNEKPKLSWTWSWQEICFKMGNDIKTSHGWTRLKLWKQVKWLLVKFKKLRSFACS